MQERVDVEAVGTAIQLMCRTVVLERYRQLGVTFQDRNIYAEISGCVALEEFGSRRASGNEQRIS